MGNAECRIKECIFQMVEVEKKEHREKEINDAGGTGDTWAQMKALALKTLYSYII